MGIVSRKKQKKSKTKKNQRKTRKSRQNRKKIQIKKGGGKMSDYTLDEDKLLGQGSNGVAGTTDSSTARGGGGGSGGGAGVTTDSPAAGGTGGTYGGGGGCGGGSGPSPGVTGNGWQGAVRIIWPGTTRQFPSTGTTDQ